MSLVLVGVWLASVGAADLGRLAHDQSTRTRRTASVLVGVLVLATGLVVVELGWAARVVLLVLGSSLLAGWSSRVGAVLRTVCLVGGIGGAALAAGLVRAERPWPAWLASTVLATWSTSAVLVTLGVVVAQVGTANLVVRLLLDAVGVPATDNEKQLKGGRVLGPMERVFLVCLGALGALTAAAVVVAAKGLLRFPELQRVQRRGDDEPDGPSDVTEYFLIGSLASWLLAFAGAALVRLAA
jgi:hypothetical protein